VLKITLDHPTPLHILKTREEKPRYHGNWCGPNWSAGKQQPSVDSDFPAVDAFDETCRDHDRSYARNEDRVAADKLFIERNSFSATKSPKRALAALAVSFNKHPSSDPPAQLHRPELHLPPVRPAILMPRRRNRRQTPGPRRSRSRSRSRSKGRSRSRSRSRTVTNAVPLNRTVKIDAGPLSISESRGRSQPRGRAKGPRRVRQGAGSRLYVSGTDYVGTITVASTNKVGDTLLQVGVFPNTLNNSRMSLFSQLFEKYRIRRFEVEYVPQVSANQAGNVVMFYDPDPYDLVGSGPTALTRAMSAQRNVDFNVYTRTGLNCLPPSGTPDLYTGDNANDLRLSRAGNCYLMLNSDGAAVGNVTLGTVLLHWSFEFKYPLAEGTNATTYSATTYNCLSGFSVTFPNGSAPVPDNGNNILGITVNSTGMIVPPGVYFILYQMTQSSSSGTSTISWLLPANNGAISNITNGTLAGTGAGTLSCSAVWDCSNLTIPATIGYSVGFAGTVTATAVRLWVFRLSPAFDTLALFKAPMLNGKGMSDTIAKLSRQVAELQAQAARTGRSEEEDDDSGADEWTPTKRRTVSAESRRLLSRT